MGINGTVTFGTLARGLNREEVSIKGGLLGQVSLYLLGSDCKFRLVRIVLGS